MNVVVETVSAKTLIVTAGDAMTQVYRGGDAESGGFRSVDLLLAGLGSCMIGTMLGEAERQSIPVRGARVELRPIVAFTPERVSRIRMSMSLNGEFTDEQLEQLRSAAESCKVHNSLHLGVKTELEVSVEAPTPTAVGE